MAKKDEFGKNFYWVITVSLIAGILSAVFTETSHLVFNILIGFGVAFLALVALSSVFLSK